MDINLVEELNMGWLKQEGEEDGIKWVVDWINGWDITVTKGDLIEHENIGGYEPRFGVDVLDLNRIEETLDKLIAKLKNENFITKLKRFIKNGRFGWQIWQIIREG